MKNVEKFNKYIRKGYTKIQNEVFKMNLPPGAIVLYLFLRSMPESYYPTPTSIKKNIQLSKKSYYRYMIVLESCRMIRKIASHSFNLENPTENKSTQYEFLDKPNWVKYKSKSKKSKEVNTLEIQKWS